MKNIVLIGFMGSGKTVVGRLLADRLGYKFIDTDKIIEERIGKTISDIWKMAQLKLKKMALYLQQNQS